MTIVGYYIKNADYVMNIDYKDMNSVVYKGRKHNIKTLENKDTTTGRARWARTLENNNRETTVTSGELLDRVRV